MNKGLQAQIQDYIQGAIQLPGEIKELLQTVKASLEYCENASSEIEVLLENILDVVFAVDMRTYTLLQISQSCKTVYGYDAEEFRKNPNLWYDLILLEDRPIIDANYAIMNAGHSFTQEYRIQHKDGSIRWLKSKMTPIMEDGRIIRLYGITSDITEKMMDSLAREDMTRALIARNNSLERFTNTISHDLRGALTKVMGIINLFRELTLTEEEKVQLMQELFTETANMEKVTRDLNDILGGKDKL